MAKSLANKLRTGAMVGLAALAVMAPGKAKGATTTNLVYDSGLQTVTNAVLGGEYVVEYQQKIKEFVINGGSTNDFYQSEMYVKNKTLAPAITNTYDKSFFELRVYADLPNRDATGLTNFVGGWNWKVNGVEDGSYFASNSYFTITPAFWDRFYYTIKKDLNGDGINDIIEFGDVDAHVTANRGVVPLGFKAPVTEIVKPFPQKIYIDSDAKKVIWYSQTNAVSNPTNRFIVYKSTNLLNSVWRTNDLTGWKPVATNVHSTTSTKYEHNIPTNEPKAFYGIREEKVN